MPLETCTIAGRPCAIWVPPTGGPFPVAVCCGGDLSKRLPALAQACPTHLFFAPLGDWNDDYTPWPAPALPGRAPFLGGGPAFLHALEHEWLVALSHRYPVRRGAQHTSIMGYSLGGLFALWALCSSRAFGAAASLSGSLWYAGWMDFLCAHLPDLHSRVYLSLGSKEHRGGPALMRTVRTCTEQTADILARHLGEASVTFAWHPGGHFTDPDGRWRQGAQWLYGIAR